MQYPVDPGASIFCVPDAVCFSPPLCTLITFPSSSAACSVTSSTVPQLRKQLVRKGKFRNAHRLCIPCSPPPPIVPPLSSAAVTCAFWAVGSTLPEVDLRPTSINSAAVVVSSLRRTCAHASARRGATVSVVVLLVAHLAVVDTGADVENDAGGEYTMDYT